MIYKNTHPGQFILFEGIEGSGKTTQVPLLADHLRNDGYKVFATREPTNDNIFGRLARFIYTCESLHKSAPDELTRCMASTDYHALEDIADVFHQKHIGRFEQIAREVIIGDHKNLQTLLQLTMIFDRFLHHRDTIIPHLQQGIHVIVDRDFLSTLAYSAADNIAWEPLWKAHEEILGCAFLAPDILFFLDISVHVGLKRTMAKQGGRKEYFDTEVRLVKIRDRYHELIKAPDIAEHMHVITIDGGSASPEQVHEIIWPYCHTLLTEKSV